MKIALVAPPLLPVPPVRYGGVERVVGVLADGLLARGHDVTLFAPGDSTFRGRLVATVPEGLWNETFQPDPEPQYIETIRLVMDRAREFDLIHDHLDAHGFALASAVVPVIGTIHGRTDTDPIAAAIRADTHKRLVAISDSQRSFAPDANWIATIHHGLDFSSVGEGRGDGGYLVFVGRLSHDKGVDDAVEVAERAGIMLRVAAKLLDPQERAIYEATIAPAVDHGTVEFLGELGEADRNELTGDALATVMLSRWPEPFGLVAIESLAAGTPVIASPAGALPEIVVDGVDGFIVDNPLEAAAAIARVGRLDRARIRQRALERFSAARMLDAHERVYEGVLNGDL